MKKCNLLNRKKKNTWWLWLLIAFGVLALLALLFLIARRNYWLNWNESRIHYSWYWQYENTSTVCWLSPDVTFRKTNYGTNCDGFLYDELSRTKVDYHTPALRWVQPNYKDSLAIGAIEGRRGFFNRFTGEQVLPFDYTRAWFFSEGMAAVTDTADNLFFINKRGNRAIKQTYRYSPSLRYEGYLFRNGHCVMNDSADRIGMIGRDGQWIMQPTWDMIVWRDGYWELRRNDSIQLLDSTLRTIVPKMKATESRRYSTAGPQHGWNILVEIPNKPSQLYSPQGQLLSDKIFARVEPLLYRVDHQVDYPYDTCYSEQKPSACSMYINMAGERGLMNKNGHILTDAIYYDIKAVDNGLFRAQITFSPNNIYIMLDANGKEIK